MAEQDRNPEELERELALAQAQAKKYAQDFAELYKSEKAKRDELEQFNRELEQRNRELEKTLAERDRMRQEVLGLENELSRQFHTIQVGMLASGLTHDLRNPLALVQMNCEVLEMNVKRGRKVLTETDPEFEDILTATKNISNGILRLDSMIDEVMDYHRMNSDQTKTVVDLNRVLSADLKMLRADLDMKHKITVDVELSNDQTWVRATANDITMIFLNLVSNARDALMQHDVRKITISSGVEEEWGWFQVADSGPGIPPEVREKIGEAFFTTKATNEEARKRGSGTGLGHHMIRRILEQRGGKMKLASVPGDTHFRIYLPSGQPPEEENL